VSLSQLFNTLTIGVVVDVLRKVRTGQPNGPVMRRPSL
jgi:hypothetical protein